MALFGLMDVNNFYCSCERVFAPRLKDKPIIVLSNNDGCVISRSEEAKALGVAMGVPYHEVKALCQKHKVKVFSANYQLYADMSNRVMKALRKFVPDMEIYSIDEAFMLLDSLKIANVVGYCRQIEATLLQWTGLPVTIGLGPTKVLAKVASFIAKKQRSGVYHLSDENDIDNWLGYIEVGEVWGIGRHFGKRLNELGMMTAYDLKQANTALLRKRFNVVMERIVYELRGQSCLALETLEPRQQIVSSKSFGYKLTELEPLQEALSNYIVTACTKLRQQSSKASGMYVYLRTNCFNAKEEQYQNHIAINFEKATADSSEIIGYGKSLLKNIYRKGYRYHKTGVTLYGIVPAELEQGDLFAESNPKRDQLMQTLDTINETYGKNSLFIAAQGIEREWQMRCDYRSPRYTTQWQELPEVR